MGKFVDKYNGPDVNFKMANTFSTDEGTMFGIYENEKLASVVRGHANEMEGAFILTKRSKRKAFAERFLGIFKCSVFILSILCVCVFLGTVTRFFSNDMGLESYVTVLIASFFGTGFFMYLSGIIEEYI